MERPAGQDPAAADRRRGGAAAGLGDVIDLDEVRDVYLPLSRLLNLYVQATSGLRGALNTFLGDAGNGHGEQRGTPSS